MRDLRERLRAAVRWEVGLVFALAAVIVFGVSASSQFLTSTNFFFLNLSIGEVAIMALPMTLIIVTGEIDLSVASVLGMSSAILGELVNHGWSVPLAIAAVVVVGGVAIFGGSGNVAGAALGALLLNAILTALYVLGVSPFWNQAIAGGLLLGAIALDRGISLRLAAILTKKKAHLGA